MWSGNVVVAAINSGNLGFLFSSQGRLPSARNDRGVGGGLFRSHDATVGEYLIMLDKCFKYCKSVSTETDFLMLLGAKRSSEGRVKPLYVTIPPSKRRRVLSRGVINNSLREYRNACTVNNFSSITFYPHVLVLKTSLICKCLITQRSLINLVGRLKTRRMARRDGFDNVQTTDLDLARCPNHCRLTNRTDHARAS